jgi:hypothetical protein
MAHLIKRDLLCQYSKIPKKILDEFFGKPVVVRLPASPQRGKIRISR